MIALAAFSNVQAAEVPVGKLSVYDEQPQVVAPLIESFLQSNLKVG